MNNVVYVQYESLQSVQENLSSLEKGFTTLSIKFEQLQTNMEKISPQNEVMLNMILELSKKSSATSLFNPIVNINSKAGLNELEQKLEDDQYKENMAYAYTQYTYKGDAKKEINGFVKSILNKLLLEQFCQVLKWDRIKKVDSNLAADIDEIIFFKKYSNILLFITDVCNKMKKEGSGFYNKDNVSQAAQDYFKRKPYTKT